MNKQELRKPLIRLCSVALALCICIITAINVAYAEEKTINVTLKTSVMGQADGEGEVYKNIDKDINNLIELDENTSELNATSTLTLSTDNIDVAGVGYTTVKIKNQDAEWKYNSRLVDGITFTGLQLRYIDADSDEEFKAGTWIESVSLCAKRKGTANITMTIDNSGVITTRVYHITVKGTKPSFGKKLSSRKICVGEEAKLNIYSISDYAKVTMSCNKEGGAIAFITADNSNEIFHKTKLGRKAKTVITPSNGDVYGFVPKKSGNLVITVSIEQDGKTYTRKYKLDTKKYKNPFKSFVIDGKDYAKYFAKKRTVTDIKNMTDAKTISYKDCKRTLGGKPFKIKMNKGYKLQKITYSSLYKNGGEKQFKWSTSAAKLPKSFWELHITYKDSKGRLWTNSFFYSTYMEG